MCHCHSALRASPGPALREGEDAPRGEGRQHLWAWLAPAAETRLQRPSIHHFPGGYGYILRPRGGKSAAGTQDEALGSLSRGLE